MRLPAPCDVPVRPLSGRRSTDDAVPHDCDCCCHDRLDRRAASNVRRGRGRRARAARRHDRLPGRPVHRDHGAVGLRQVDADAPARRASTARRPARSSSTSQELANLDDKRLTSLRRDKLGFVFQAFNLIPVLTARENITLPLMLAGTKVDDAWFDTLVDAVGLGDRLTHRPGRAVGRPAAARRDRPRADLPPRRGVRRRADRQPRLQVRRTRCSTCCAARSTSSTRR